MQLDPTEILAEFDGLHGIGHWLRSAILLEFVHHRNGPTNTSYVVTYRLKYYMPDRRNSWQRDFIEKGKVIFI